MNDKAEIAVLRQALEFAIGDRDKNLDELIQVQGRLAKSEKDARRYRVLRDRLEVTRNTAVPNCISMDHILTDCRVNGDKRLIDLAIDEIATGHD